MDGDWGPVPQLWPRSFIGWNIFQFSPWSSDTSRWIGILVVDSPMTADDLTQLPIIKSKDIPNLCWCVSFRTKSDVSKTESSSLVDLALRMTSSISFPRWPRNGAIYLNYLKSESFNKLTFFTGRTLNSHPPFIIRTLLSWNWQYIYIYLEYCFKINNKCFVYCCWK